MTGDYTRNRQRYQDISGQLRMTASTDDTTLVTVRNSSHQIYIQKLYVTLTTATSATISFEDSTTGAQIAYVDGAVGTGAPWTFDFGPEGVALTLGESFLMNVSATGNVGLVHWEGYQKLGAVVAVGSM